MYKTRILPRLRAYIMDYEMIYRERGRDAMFKIWHATEEATFIYTYSDGGSIVCSEKAYPIKRGTLCFIGSGKYHYTMPSNPETYERTKLFVSQSELLELLRLLGGNLGSKYSEGAFVYAEIPEDKRESLENELMEYSKIDSKDGFSSAMIGCCALKLVALAERYSKESVPSASGIVGRAIEYINNNIFEDIGIDDICKAVHVSKYYFCRSFKAKTKMSVMQYVLKTRIVMAGVMLEKERISVTEVSSRCGFSSVSYFSRAFKCETGMTPLEYRRKRSR